MYLLNQEVSDRLINQLRSCVLRRGSVHHQSYGNVYFTKTLIVIGHPFSKGGQNEPRSLQVRGNNCKNAEAINWYCRYWKSAERTLPLRRISLWQSGAFSFFSPGNLVFIKFDSPYKIQMMKKILVFDKVFSILVFLTCENDTFQKKTRSLVES